MVFLKFIITLTGKLSGRSVRGVAVCAEQGETVGGDHGMQEFEKNGRAWIVRFD